MAAPVPGDRLKARMLEVHARLCRAYGCPIAAFHDLEPLDELVSSLLSHRTRNADSARAYRELKARFPNWEAVRDAPVTEVEAAITACTWPEAKAPALQRTLRAVTEARGALDLSHLKDMPVPEARAWLETLPGVGPKTSAAVLSFSTLRRRALPVDSHHHRVAQRLGLIPGNLSVGPSHRVLEAMLPEEWDAQAVYDNHQALMRHGQKVCHFHKPACGSCVVLELCPTGQARMSAPARSTQPGSALTGDEAG